MIIAVVGSGGKTTLVKKLADRYHSEGKTVLVTTTTHMFIEEHTLLTDDADVICRALKETGYVMAGLPDGMKLKPLSQETFDAVCDCADVVLVEADGSRMRPLKYPNATEPVIPDNTDEIIVVCGLNAIGQQAKDVCHRMELVQACLGISEDTRIEPEHIQKLVTEGYLNPLRKAYPHAKVSVSPRHDGSLYQRTVASLLQHEQDVTLIRKEWFCPQPRLILCGGGHVSREVAAFAHRLDFAVTVIDDRPEAVTRDRFPTAEKLICDSYGNLENYLEDDACYVVVTPDHKADLQCVSTVLPTRYRYLGMIGSRKKVASTMENLKNAGFSQEKISSIFAPIGLPIGAVTPAEIALSILSQIVQEKNKTHAASADKALLEVTESGMLCVIIEKHGSAPRGVGSMMFVGQEDVLGSIGGGEPEFLAICHAKENRCFGIREYSLNNTAANGLDMICGGRITVLFIPV
jgi:xanthine dehydrogenase accessory factor